MSLISLNNIPVIGNETIDGQHRLLAENINELYKAAAEKKGKSKIREIVQFLQAYAKEHFKYEEDFFEKIDYPEIEPHKLEHKWFTDQVKNLKKRVSKGITESEVQDELVLLSQWFFKHTKVEDQKYKKYIKKLKFFG